ncbi:derlin protein [Rhizoctonia solani AG-3 Rhs1AP]|uniref:Derlin n=1 Tax=Rhizoctonia solani AG-3 Rhs1AP TaxID=1086054 RepID=X8J1K9_9AGAM|nr:derlin protein [Rhizoctonia solani AG-3 Rhs1AP]
MENIPEMFRRIPPVTKFILAGTMMVSVPTMLGILPAASVVFDPHYAFQGGEIWRVGTAWFYSPSSELFLFMVGMFLLYHSTLNLETNLFDGRSADYAWQITLSAILIMGLNIPLKTAILSRPLLHLLIYRDSCSVKNPSISVLDLVHIPRRYLPWAVLALDAIMDGPLAFCRSLTGVLVAHIWLMLIPRPSVLQTAESKTADDQPKKPLPGWRKYAAAPGWVRKVIPNERDPRGDGGHTTRPGGNVRTLHGGRSMGAGYGLNSGCSRCLVTN